MLVLSVAVCSTSVDTVGPFGALNLATRIVELCCGVPQCIARCLYATKESLPPPPPLVAPGPLAFLAHGLKCFSLFLIRLLFPIAPLVFLVKLLLPPPLLLIPPSFRPAVLRYRQIFFNPFALRLEAGRSCWNRPCHLRLSTFLHLRLHSETILEHSPPHVRPSPYRVWT